MVNAREREKLMQEMIQSPSGGLYIVVRCAVALAFLAVAAVVGTTGDQPEVQVAATSQSAPAQR